VKQSFQDKGQHRCGCRTMTKKVAARDKKLNFDRLKRDFESTINAHE
jgi:hypothetical protein